MCFHWRLFVEKCAGDNDRLNVFIAFFNGSYTVDRCPSKGHLLFVCDMIL